MEYESDEILMQKVKMGYLEAFSILFERYQHPIYNYFVRTTHDLEESRDLTQTTLQRVYKYRSSFHETHLFRPWIYRMARNLRIDSVRKKIRNSEQRLNEESNTVYTETHCGNRSLRKLELEDALSQLDEKDRELIQLKKYQGLSYDEIARILDEPTSTLRTKMHRAMLKLKDIYYEERSLS